MASLTLTVLDAHVPRILEAFGYRQQSLVYPVVPATAEEVRQALLQHVREVVLDYEAKKAASTAAAAVTPVTVS